MRGFVCVIALVFVAALASVSADEEDMNRQLRSFPYMPMVRMLRPPESSLGPRLSYPSLPASPVEREIADLIEAMDNPARPRRSADASPIYKRYACRFKFCRIFDA